MGKFQDGERTRRPREPEWIHEHGAKFYLDKSGVRNFETPRDLDLWFKAEHGDCHVCSGTGYELFKRGRHSWARRCSRLPASHGESASGRPGGFRAATEHEAVDRESSGSAASEDATTPDDKLWMYEDAVNRSPQKRPGERVIDYLDRICEAARAREAASIRLPYREPGDDDE